MHHILSSGFEWNAHLWSIPSFGGGAVEVPFVIGKVHGVLAVGLNGHFCFEKRSGPEASCPYIEVVPGDREELPFHENIFMFWIVGQCSYHFERGIVACSKWAVEIETINDGRV